MGGIKKAAKIVGKTIGTTVLAVTGTASAILKTTSDSTGFELGSSLFGASQNASFNGIRKMWSKKAVNDFTKSAEKHIKTNTLYTVRSTYESKADAAKKIANTAKEKGRMDKYDEYMDVYKESKAKSKRLDSQYRNAIK